MLLPSRAVILTLSHPRQGGLPSAENHHRLHRAKKDTYSPPDRARGRTKRTRTPPRALSNIVYTQPVDPRRDLVDRSSTMAVVHAAALNEVHHAAGRIWQREGGILMGLRRWLLRVHTIDASSLQNPARNARFGHEHPQHD